MKIFGVAGWSGSGKTTLVVRLLPELVARGITVSTMKHAHHDFDVDKPGKDSFEHRRAGATEVLVSSTHRWALMHEHRGTAPPDSATLMRHMAPVDLVLIEGFKTETHDKLEVHRPALGKPLLCREDPQIVAVASDGALPGLDIPVLDLDDIPGIANFVIAHCGLGQRSDSDH
jgi:molybdopterin-guanine dinucleotide biosynthesis protein B